MRKFEISQFLIKNKKIFIITAILIIIIAVIMVSISLYSNFQKGKTSTVFGIKELIIYNNATLINNSSSQSLENLNICQYSDISVYINNNLEEGSELTNENTIKSMYIDNISVASNSDVGTKILNYKNPLDFGKYLSLSNNDNDKINFNIINTNEQNNYTDYSSPTFYTDCSNPISLGYLNNNIVQNYSISDNSNTISYNAKVLKEAGVNLETINNTLNFTIHITDNLNHKYYCNMSININLDEDFLNNGYSYTTIPVSSEEYNFIRE